jgi:hypothetical protein
MPNRDVSVFTGQSIDQICENGFHDAALNHCAHFVSHFLTLDFSTNCADLKGTSKPAANVRVHEVFEKCPKVGKWEDADLARSQLMFVTRAGNVDLAAKTMVNIPKKHIGVFQDGKVYHYSNSADRVVADTPAQFMTKFNAVYGPGQGYFFGWFPNEDLELNISTNGADASAPMKFDLNQAGAIWRAQKLGDAQDFLVGKEVNQATKKYHGINVPIADYWGPLFNGDDYHAQIDHWAYLLEATGTCESKNRMVLVNTYDRAKFTFGFYQLAAHTPEDNLILLFRELIKLPRFAQYFPDLVMHSGHLHRIDSSGTATDLETAMPTGPGGEKNLQFFMNYLNPNRKLIDEQEVLMAARLIHWSLNDPAALAAQVRVSSAILQDKMAQRHHPKLGLDGRSDVVCTIICDILHQGRALYSELRPILAASQPVEALLTFKQAQYGTRNNTLRSAIARLTAQGKLGTKTYHAAGNEFL